MSKESDFMYRLNLFVDKIRGKGELKGVFECYKCKEESLVKLEGDRNQEMIWYCNNCKFGVKGTIYD